MGRRGGGMRMKSAKPSVPVRSGSGRSAPRAAPAQTPSQPSQRAPGLMAQMAATAGGVAIGSAVGHTVGNMLSGGGGGGEEVQQQQPQEQLVNQRQQYAAPCEFEMKQFLECTQQQNDVGLCQGFSDILKQCRARYAV